MSKTIWLSIGVVLCLLSCVDIFFVSEIASTISTFAKCVSFVPLIRYIKICEEEEEENSQKRRADNDRTRAD